MEENFRWRVERSPSSEAEDSYRFLYVIFKIRNPSASVEDWFRHAEQVRDCSRVESRGEFLLRKVKQEGLGWTSEPVAWCDANARIGLGYCIDAISASSSERESAWTYAADAIERTAIAMTLAMAIHRSRKSATKAAGVRHAENRGLKKDAIDWYLANRGEGRSRMSKDSAAERIAGKIVPTKFRTVRDWLSQVKD